MDGEDKMFKKSSFRKLIDFTDDKAREEMGDYYIVSESRMNNILHCVESGAEQIKRSAKEYAALRAEIERKDDALRGLLDGVNALPPLTAIQGVLTEQCRIAEEALVPAKEEE